MLKAVDSDKELDYDPWLSAQDSDPKIVKTLTVKTNKGISNGYIVTYEDDFTKNKIPIKLTVVKEKDVYKIDSVQSEGGKKYGGGK